MNKNNTYTGRGSQTHLPQRFEKQAYEPEKDAQLLEEETSTRTEWIAAHPKSILNRVESPDIGMSWSLNPYQGCEHGCVYCYARTTHEYWGYNAGLDFESKILYKAQAPQLLEKELQRPDWEVLPIMLSGNTDCYQPVERKLKITRRILEVLHRYRHPVGMITKNSLIERDLDILSPMAKEGLVHVSISITSLREEIRRALEPRTASANSKLRTIERLSRAGIPVNVMMAPIIPGLNSDEIFKLARAVADAGASSFNYTLLRLNGITSLLFSDWVHKAFPLKAKKILNLTASCHGGKLSDHRFGKRMRGEGPLAESIAQQVQQARVKSGLQQKLPPYNLEAFVRTNKGQLGLW